MLTPLVFVAVLGNITISEVRLDSSVSLPDVEYIELKGTPNETLDGKHILVLGPTGQIDGIVPLVGYIPNDGVCLISSSFALMEQPDISAPINIGDEQNVTIMLIDGPPQYLIGSDLDWDNDGIIDEDVMVCIDSIQFKVISGPTYSPTVLDGQGIYIWGAERCADNDELWKLLPKQYPTELDSPGEPNEICGGTIESCLGDINGDSAVNTIDLSIMIGSWNTNNQDCDLNLDEIVNIDDLSILLGNWDLVAPVNNLTS